MLGANHPRVEPSDSPAAGSVVHVVVCLTGGDRVVAGSFADEGLAQKAAEKLMRGFAKTDGRWPFVEGRYLRPEAVVSIDLVEEENRRWVGSQLRRRVSDEPVSS